MSTHSKQSHLENPPRGLFSKRLMAAAFGVLALPAIDVPRASAQLLLEEVIVTARRREENLQESPLAVTALSGQELRQAGINNLSDLNQMVPNIDVQSGNGSSRTASIYIRGVGQRNTGVQIDSGVGIYIDEVYVGRPDGGLLDMNDIQSVQVLRGPQGTLFGKNTTGGALVFTTNRPTDELGGSVEARVGNYGRLDAGGVLNLPLTDTLWSRFSVLSRNSDGYLDNAFDGDEYMGDDRINAVAQLRWAPTDSLTIDLNYNYNDVDEKGRPLKCQKPDFTGWQEQLYNVIGIVPATGQTYGDFCREAENLGDEQDVINDLNVDFESENQGLSLTANWDINDDFTVKSITAWRNTDAGQADDVDASGIPFLHRSNLSHPFGANRETDQYSQELQLIGSAFDDRLEFVAGGFWFKEEGEDGIATNQIGPYFPGIAGLFVFSTTATLLESDNEAWAAFAQADWSWNDNWRTTLGVRYTDEDRELFRERYGPVVSTLDANGGPITAIPGGLYFVSPGFEYNPNYDFQPLDTTEDKVGDDDTTIMASMQYLIDPGDFIDTGSIYLTYSEGFRSGGLSEAPGDEFDTFEPEEVENWELGFKLDMFKRTLRVNGAFFYTDYKNRQLTTIVINPATQSPAGATINAKESTISGLELETTWLPTANLEIAFNASWNDGDIDEFDDTSITLTDPGSPVPDGCERVSLGGLVNMNSCDVDRSNENLPRLPEATYFLSAQYRWDSSLGTIIPRVQVSYKEDIEMCLDATSCLTDDYLEEEQWDLSARVTWLSNDGNWQGAIFGNNLTDEDYINGASALVESLGSAGMSYAAPRTYGAELKYSF